MPEYPAIERFLLQQAGRTYDLQALHEFQKVTPTSLDREIARAYN